jgi:hypothetical protein
LCSLSHPHALHWYFIHCSYLGEQLHQFKTPP